MKSEKKAMKIKKATAAIAALSLAVSGVPVQNIFVDDMAIVRAASKDGDTFTKDGLLYEVIESNTELRVVSVAEDFTLGQLVIPATITYEGYDFPVTQLKNGFMKDNKVITSLAFAPGSPITTIGKTSFKNCPNLTSISLPEGITTIGELAFENCTGLTSVILPTTLTTVDGDESPFKGCTNLKEIKFTEGTKKIANHICYNLDFFTGTEVTIPASVETIGKYAFADLANYKTQLVFSENLKVIEEGAFKNSNQIDAITFSNGLVSLGDSAFAGLDKVTSVVLPNTLTTLGNNTFAKCNGLTEVTIPKSVTTVDNDLDSSFESNRQGPFNECEGLKKVVFEEGMVRIPDGILYGAHAVEEVVLPGTVTVIGWSAFNNCKSLGNVTFPVNLTEIERYAFSECTSLAAIELPATVTTLGIATFNNCTRIKEVTIPKGLTTVKNDLDSSFESNKYSPFYGCTNLKKVVFEDGTTKIPDGILYGTVGVTDVVMPNTVTDIGWSAFNGCKGIVNITLPENVQVIGKTAFNNCTALESLVLPKTLTTLGLSAFGNCTRIQEVVIPNSVTKVVNNLASSFESNKYSPFYGCEELKKVVFEDGMDTIPAGILYGVASVEQVVLPATASAIGEMAFYGCAGVKSVNIPNTVTVIDHYAFGSTGLESVVLPDGLTTLGKAAFRNTLIKEVVIPNTVTTITNDVTSSLTYNRYSPFYECPELKKVVFEDGMEKIPTGVLYGASSVEEVVLPATASAIGVAAFAECKGLKNVAIPNTVTVIGDNAFNGAGLEAVVLPDELTTLGRAAFMGCPIKEVVIPNTVTKSNNDVNSWSSSSRYSAFYGCEELKKVVFEDGMKNIPAGILYGASGVQEIVLPATASAIGQAAFAECSKVTSITIPATVVKIDKNVFAEWGEFSICGLTGSYAETYAKANNIPFISQGTYVPPVETTAPVVTATPAETQKPAETTKPVETQKPAETTKPVETQKPAETTKPAEKVTVAKVKIVTAKRAGVKKAVIKWKKISKVNGYEIVVSTNKSFKGKNVKMVSANKTSYQWKGLQKNKKYYVKIRAYKKDGNGKKVYGKYSSVKVIAKR